MYLTPSAIAYDLRFKNFHKEEYDANYEQARARYFESLSKIPERNELTNEQLMELNLLNKKRAYWDNIEDECIYNVVKTGVENLEKSAMGLKSVVSKTMLEMELSICKKFDVLELEMVQKCF
ncbi:MAG: hypothetical protein KAQ98_00225 [Bacteriovoracaceae bacterium]|nr:hypothetical protein [Bacteriovoracaceae bacterium]